MAHSGMSEAVMADVLDGQAPDSIAQLAAVGWSIRRIFRHLGLERETIRRYLRHPPDPERPPPDPKSPAILTARTGGGRNDCRIVDPGKMSASVLPSSRTVPVPAQSQRSRRVES